MLVLSQSLLRVCRRALSHFQMVNTLQTVNDLIQPLLLDDCSKQYHTAHERRIDDLEIMERLGVYSARELETSSTSRAAHQQQVSETITIIFTDSSDSAALRPLVRLASLFWHG